MRPPNKMHDDMYVSARIEKIHESNCYGARRAYVSSMGEWGTRLEVKSGIHKKGTEVAKCTRKAMNYNTSFIGMVNPFDELI